MLKHSVRVPRRAGDRRPQPWATRHNRRKKSQKPKDSVKTGHDAGPHTGVRRSPPHDSPVAVHGPRHRTPRLARFWLFWEFTSGADTEALHPELGSDGSDEPHGAVLDDLGHRGNGRARR